MASDANSGHADAVAAVSTPSGRSGRIPLHICIATLFTLLIVVVGGVIAWRNYIEHRRLIISASQELVQAIGGKTAAAFASIDQPAKLLIDLLARQRLVQAANLADRMNNLAYLADALEHSPLLSALNIGYGNGDFFLLRPLLATPRCAPSSKPRLPQTISYKALSAIMSVHPAGLTYSWITNRG